ncbi:hypothetical protein M0R45_006940 [Rubus argutus]|uniref:Uncharacterized protein n=1 Tax=Rubus argutus TaxID=59490 RepID=A0AAW1YSL7_RUBAR
MGSSSEGALCSMDGARCTRYSPWLNVLRTSVTWYGSSHRWLNVMAVESLVLNLTRRSTQSPSLRERTLASVSNLRLSLFLCSTFQRLACSRRSSSRSRLRHSCSSFSFGSKVSIL